MAIFGAGSNWSEGEQKEDFIEDENFTVGWDYNNARDLFDSISLLKAGDIIYLKANSAGSKIIKVKAIGVVKTSFVHSLIDNQAIANDIYDWNSFSIEVKWIVTEDFFITIPATEGKLTNIRSATFYEEHLPFVQKRILQKLFNHNFKNNKYMDYGLGQFITGVISITLQVLQIWSETKNIGAVRAKTEQFEEILVSKTVIEEGEYLQNLVPLSVLNALRRRVDFCWSDFQDAVENLNITPSQLDRYTKGLTECICRELKVIKTLNEKLPTQTMNDWWNKYKCEN